MGTIVNAIAIIIGGGIGLLLKKGLPQRVEEIAMKMLGLSVFMVGINGVITAMITVVDGGKLESNGSLLLIASLVIGGVVGELLDVDSALNRAGKRIEERFGKEGFAKGFISASLIFCIGAMAIIGSLQDGLTGDSTTLFIKSTLDFVCALVLGSTLGYGVVFSFVPVLVYQGAITLLAGVISPFISDALLGNICMVGYAIVLTIGINFLQFTTIKTANLLPALLVPIVYAAVQPLLASIMTVILP